MALERDGRMEGACSDEIAYERNILFGAFPITANRRMIRLERRNTRPAVFSLGRRGTFKFPDETVNRNSLTVGFNYLRSTGRAM